MALHLRPLYNEPMKDQCALVYHWYTIKQGSYQNNSQKNVEFQHYLL